MNPFSNKNGIILVAAIMMMTFVSIAVLGVTTFIVERLHQSESRKTELAFINSAEAGINHAIYFYRFNNGFFPFGQTYIDGNNYFVLGGTPADSLIVDTSGAYMGPTTGSPGQRYRYLYGIKLHNASSSGTITLTQMIVTWNNSVKLREISIGGISRWSGNGGSPATCPFSSTVTLTSAITNLDFLRFQNSVNGAVINIEFFLSDGTSKTVNDVLTTDTSGFTIKATGKIAGSNSFRTIEAKYEPLTQKITDYHEIDQQIVP